MADEPEDDILELGEPPEEQDEAAVETNDEAEQQADDEQDDDEELPTFGDPGEEGEQDTPLAKHLRAQIRERDKRIAELDKSAKPEPEIVVGDKPTLESCDYDEEKFETELDAYKDRKRKAEEQANKGKEVQQAATKQWQEEQADYVKKRTALPFRAETIAEAEAIIAGALDPNQITCLVKAANNAPVLAVALSRNPAKLAAIAQIKDYVKFSAALVRLEAEVKMAKRRPTVEPDKIVRGSASLASTNAAKTLEKLEKEAEATGNRDKIIAFKRAQKEKAA